MLSIFRAAEENPTGLALATASQRLDFRALAERAARIASGLGQRGLLGAEPLAVVARPTLATLETLHALIAYQCPIVLVHPSLPTPERLALASRAGARAVLAPDEEPLPLADARLEPPREEEPNRPLAIIPTSGSSGTPKLVVLSRAAFTASAALSAQNLPLDRSDRWLLCLPPAHVGGFSIVTRCLLARAAVVAFESNPKGLVRSLPALATCLSEQRVTLMSLVPTLLDSLLSAQPNWRPESTLRAVLIGGAALSSELLERAAARGVPLLTTYGLTEACSQVTTSRPGVPPALSGGVVSAGFALPNVELRLGEGSRICVRAPTLCSGYLDAPSPIDANGWLHTEDRGFIDDTGELFVLGRIGDLIITGGENVDPRRVEAALLSAEGVEAALVFGVPDVRFGELVCCALVTQNGFVPARVSAQLQQRLSRHELPRGVLLLDALPLLENGKVDVRAVRRLAENGFQPFEHAR